MQETDKKKLFEEHLKEFYFRERPSIMIQDKRTLRKELRVLERDKKTAKLVNPKQYKLGDEKKAFEDIVCRVGEKKAPVLKWKMKCGEWCIIPHGQLTNYIGAYLRGDFDA